MKSVVAADEAVLGLSFFSFLFFSHLRRTAYNRAPGETMGYLLFIGSVDAGQQRSMQLIGLPRPP